MFEDLLVQRKEILEKLETVTDMRERGSLRERLAEINKAFNYETEIGEDDLIDEWERDLADGRTPDLTKRAAG